jgi:SAM-dependent methyltransferase
MRLRLACHARGVAQPLDDVLAELRPMLLDPARLVRAVAAGRRRGQTPASSRVELRPVDLKTGRHLQVVEHDGRSPRTTNEAYDEGAAATVDRLMGEPFGNWHVQTTTETVQLRVTKKGEAQVHRAPVGGEQRTRHDRVKPRVLADDDPLFRVLGAGAGKRRQVEAFLRLLLPAVADVGRPPDRPLRVVDLGCGNAYLTFAAYRALSQDGPVELVGIDVRDSARNTAIAAELGWGDNVRFVAGTIADAPVGEPDAQPDVVLALHACDTATDDALARAVSWRAPLVLAAPCCHHDLQRQLRGSGGPSPYGVVTRHGILRERLGDVLTDAFRAAILREHGYRVDVVEFVESKHTPRNTLLKAVRTDAPCDGDDVAQLARDWQVTPYLRALLHDAD